jgi:carboxyl-terminal processing protease
VTDVEPGAPAEISGIRPGDRLVSVAGVGVNDAATAARRLRGEAGSTIQVDVMSKGTISTVKLTRAIVELSSVRFASTPQADVVRIRSFSLETPELVSAFKFSKKPLVLDLRGNGGGSLDGGIGTARLFLKSGERMVTVVDKRGTPLTYDAVEDGILSNRRATKAPTFVLVDVREAFIIAVLILYSGTNGERR